MILAVSTRKVVCMEIAETTHNQVALLARAWGVSESEAVQRLVEHFQHSTTPKRSDRGEPSMFTPCTKGHESRGSTIRQRKV